MFYLTKTLARKDAKQLENDLADIRVLETFARLQSHFEGTNWEGGQLGNYSVHLPGSSGNFEISWVSIHINKGILDGYFKKFVTLLGKYKEFHKGSSEFLWIFRLRTKDYIQHTLHSFFIMRIINETHEISIFFFINCNEFSFSE